MDQRVPSLFRTGCMLLSSKEQNLRGELRVGQSRERGAPFAEEKR